MNSAWHNVTRGEPCPICQHTDWCSLSNDGCVCVCRRVESNRPTASGYGWVHFLKDRPFPERRTFHARPATVPNVPPPRFESLHAGFSAEPRLIARLADLLDLPADALRRLDARFDHRRGVMSFPMRNERGNIVGLRYRDPVTRCKWAEKGSRDGLFMPADDNNAPTDRLYVTEGPTDTAAALALGLSAVGRASCLSGADLVAKCASARKAKAVTIIADNDPPHTRPDGSKWRPGLDGARRLASALALPVRIIIPPDGIKDLRSWLKAGLRPSELPEGHFFDHKRTYQVEGR